MRVHNTQNGRVVERKDDDPPYAILSHTWDESEQLFHDVQHIQHSFKSHISTLLRMVLPALLWSLTISIYYFVYFLAQVVCIHVSSLDPDDDTQHWNIFYHARIRVASTLYTQSKRLYRAAFQLVPKLSVLNDFRLSEKIRKVCAAARDHDLSQVWVDTSCLDKTSSSELSEAINSMYKWYRDAKICFVYLVDVPKSGDPRRRGSAFRYSRWFTRGWTLQELIAPPVVVFLSQEWEEIGTKENLADLIADITGIDEEVLMGRKPLKEVSVAARMSWAAERSTTKIEDQAYCLLGIFGIVMTPIYGEGMNAFRRLQEGILGRIPDDSIFAWESSVLDMPEMSYTANPRNHLIRLLDTSTAQFVEVPEDSTAPYAVLSHMWDESGEVKYDDVVTIQRNAGLSFIRVTIRWFLSTLFFLLSIFAFAVDFTPIRFAFLLKNWVYRLKNWTHRVLRPSILYDKQLSSKIRDACAVAHRAGHTLMWIDSSCVDHGNQAELRRTVASVYTWFLNAKICYVYLVDVPHHDNPRAKESSFRSSRWFTRCWTLQELVAPREVTFLSRDWQVIGTKDELADLIEEITGIDRDVLMCKKSIDNVKIVDWISWATRRDAKHPEDRAYSLLGVLNVTMTPRYGEGKWAFRRLREKILQRKPTESLEEVQWYTDDVPELSHTPMLITAVLSRSRNKLVQVTPCHSLLAPSARAFLFSRSIRPIPRSSDFYNRLGTPDRPAKHLPSTAFCPSPFGIRTHFYLIPFPKETVEVGMEARVREQWYLVILSCEDSSFPQNPHLLARLCYVIPESDSPGTILNVGEFFRGDISGPSTTLRRIDTRQERASLIHLPNFRRDFTSNLLNPLVEKDIYIPHVEYPPNFGKKTDWFGTKPRQVTKVTVSRWMKAELHSQGYHIESTTSTITPLTPDTISLYCSSIPLVVRLKKDGQEAAIFLPIREHPYDGYQYGWLIDDEDGALKTLRCAVVPTSDSDFKTLTAHARTRTIPTALLKKLTGLCHSKNEWMVGTKIARPRVKYSAAGHFDLHIDIAQA